MRAGLSQRVARGPSNRLDCNGTWSRCSRRNIRYFAEFGDMPQFTLHSLDMTVEVMRTSTCAALLPSRYAERFVRLDFMEHIPEQSLPVWACYHHTRKTDQIIKDTLDWIEQGFHRLQLSKFGKFFADIAHKWF